MRSEHSRAAAITVQVTAAGDVLEVRVGHEGTGGARLGAGTGLTSAIDRVEALGGQFALHSEPGHGISVTAHLPLTTRD